MFFYINLIFIVLIFSIFPSSAKEKDICKNVRFAETGWTDVSATTALTSIILNGLGYKTKNYILSVPVTYSALSLGDIDIFLGYWIPSMVQDFIPYKKNGTVELVRLNLINAKYSLAVPKFLYDSGLKNIKDIKKFAKDLDFSIHGIEPGNDGNRLILYMIENNYYGLKNFRLIESSEQAMLAELESRIKNKKPYVFLAWEPHPMNFRFEISYLNGGDSFFVFKNGGAAVGTNVRKGYTKECFNISLLLKNLEFNIDMENEIMNSILYKGNDPKQAALIWLKNNIKILNIWLMNVKTWDGKEGLKEVQKYIYNQIS